MSYGTIPKLKLCFLDGGRGAPQAVDTLETSAVFSVAKYLGVKAVALLMVSDLAPLNPDAPKWKWQMTEDMREQLAEHAIALAQKLIE